MPPLAALALTAVLYHASTTPSSRACCSCAPARCCTPRSERSLGKLGGLIHRMPWVAWLALVGALAIAGLPPLNGFVSEWLLLQAFLFTPEPAAVVRQHAGAGGRRGAGAGRRAGRLRDGQVLRHRSSSASRARRTSRDAHDAGWPASAPACVWLAAGCVLLGRASRSASSRCSIRSTRMLVGSAGERGGRRQLAAARADQRRPRELQPADLPGGHRRRRAADHRWSCAASTTAACAARRPGTAASRCRRRACRTPPRASASRSARSSSRSSACERQLPSPFDAAPRYSRQGRRPLLALALPADRARRRARCARLVGLHAAGPHLHLPALQLRHAARAAGRSSDERLRPPRRNCSQLVVALALAPLLVGWVNQCRAWLQNQSRAAAAAALPHASASCSTRTR